MIKPQLSDFDLTEDDVKKFEIQHKKYKEAEQEHISKTKLRMLAGIIIIPIIVMLTLAIGECGAEYRVISAIIFSPP